MHWKTCFGSTGIQVFQKLLELTRKVQIGESVFSVLGPDKYTLLREKHPAFIGQCEHEDTLFLIASKSMVGYYFVFETTEEALTFANSSGRDVDERMVKNFLLNEKDLSCTSLEAGEATIGQIVGNLYGLREMAARVSSFNVPVLITGETGVGKEVLVRFIHSLSSRKSRGFHKVNCAAFPRELMESELFGHEKGAFTGAYRTKTGKFEDAEGGALFLDEIGDLDLGLQAKLLHVLQDGNFARVGGNSIIHSDVRIYAATNRDLVQAVSRGLFRADLYYRLNVIELQVPPLREHTEDLEELTRHILVKIGKRFGRDVPDITPETWVKLRAYSWPGNIRELENVLTRAVVMMSGDAVFPQDITLNAPNSFLLPPTTQAVFGKNTSVAEIALVSKPSGLKEISRQAVGDAEKLAILAALEECQWNRIKAAKMLKISYRALMYKILQYELVNRLDTGEATSRKTSPEIPSKETTSKISREELLRALQECRWNYDKTAKQLSVSIKYIIREIQRHGIRQNEERAWFVDMRRDKKAGEIARLMDISVATMYNRLRILNLN